MTITISVLVQPRASRPKIGPRHDGRIKIAVTAQAEGNEANAAVVALLAEKLDIPKSDVTVISGKTTRRKTIRLVHVTHEQVEALL